MTTPVQRAAVLALILSAAVPAGVAWQARHEAAQRQAALEVEFARWSAAGAECTRRGLRPCGAQQAADARFNAEADRRDAAERRAEIAQPLIWQAPVAVLLLWLAVTWVSTGRLKPRRT